MDTRFHWFVTIVKPPLFLSAGVGRDESFFHEKPFYFCVVFYANYFFRLHLAVEFCFRFFTPYLPPQCSSLTWYSCNTPAPEQSKKYTYLRSEMEAPLTFEVALDKRRAIYFGFKRAKKYTHKNQWNTTAKIVTSTIRAQCMPSQCSIFHFSL